MNTSTSMSDTASMYWLMVNSLRGNCRTLSDTMRSMIVRMNGLTFLTWRNFFFDIMMAAAIMPNPPAISR